MGLFSAGCGGAGVNHAGDSVAWGVGAGGADFRMDANDGIVKDVSDASEMIGLDSCGNTASATFFGPDIRATVCDETFSPRASVCRASS